MGAAAAARPRERRGTAPPRAVMTPPRQGGAAASCSARAVCSRLSFVAALGALLLAATAAAAPPGTTISNRAEVRYVTGSGPATIVSNLLDVVVVPPPSRAALTLLRSDASGSLSVARPTQCTSSGTPSALPPPVGSNGQPFALGQALALGIAATVHGGEAVFLDLVDADRNRDAAVLDSVESRDHARTAATARASCSPKPPSTPAGSSATCRRVSARRARRLCARSSARRRAHGALYRSARLRRHGDCAASSIRTASCSIRTPARRSTARACASSSPAPARRPSCAATTASAATPPSSSRDNPRPMRAARSTRSRPACSAFRSSHPATIGSSSSPRPVRAPSRTAGVALADGRGRRTRCAGIVRRRVRRAGQCAGRRRSGRPIGSALFVEKSVGLRSPRSAISSSTW